MRADLIKSAESFLSSPNVQSADKEKKVQFLKTKGLNDEEIEVAFKRVGEGNAASHQPTTTTTHTTNTNAATATTPKLPPRPATITQIVYVPPEPIPRMTTKQLLSYVLIISFSAFGVTVTLTTIIKKIMSKIFKSIADYQSDRYKQHTKLLKQVGTTLNEYSISTAQNTSLQTAQTQLNTRLDHLVELAQSVNSDRASNKQYKGLSSNVERFRNTVLQNPFTTNQFDYYGTSGSFGTSYANRYQAVNNHNVAVQNIKSEIRSFKGMLLSRRNFPTIASPTVSSIRTIPSPVLPQQQAPASPTTTTKAAPGTPTIVADQQPVYHPRIGRRSVRAELAPTAASAESESSNPTKTTVETVKDAAVN